MSYTADRPCACDGGTKGDAGQVPGRLASRIPTVLYSRLVQLKPYLLSQLSLTPRGSSVDGPWRLRVRVDDPRLGRRRISIEVPDRRTAEAVKELVTYWRDQAEADHPEKTEEEIREEELRRYERTVRDARAKILKVWGGGSSRRRRIGHEFDRAAAAGPSTLVAYIRSGLCTLPSPRPGRPPKARLS